MIDLRSDTVTHPNEAMRRAMYNAKLGDDVYGDDPTVNLLQEQAAEMMGKEAGLFVTSGTQGNLVAVLTHTSRGDEILLGDQCHIYRHEAGAASVLGGVVMCPIKNSAIGDLSIKSITEAIKSDDCHHARTRLLCMENTHEASSGHVIDVLQTEAMASAARMAGLSVHLDGARLFNASTALGVNVADLAANSDSVTFCLSKGLGCPAGSILCGNNDFITEALRWRKKLGGGMRQVGVLAAAGQVALDTMIERLSEDHDNAQILAQGLAQIEGLSIDAKNIQTNIVRFGVPKDTGDQISKMLAMVGILVNPENSQLRMVTHYGIHSSDISIVLKAMKNIMTQSINCCV